MAASLMLICLRCLRWFFAIFSAWLISFGDAIAQQEWAPGEQAIYNEAQQLLKAGRAAEAVPLGEKRLALVERTFGPTSAQSVPATDALAGYCLEAGDAKRARELFNRAMTTSRKLHGKDDGWTITSLRGLGRLEAMEGNYDAAIPLLERSVKAAEGIFGKSDLMTGMMIEDLAQAQTRRRDYAAALPSFERVLRIREAKLGDENAGVANALLNLAIPHQKLGHFNEAEQLLLRAVAMHMKTSGSEHPHTAVALSQLGEFYRGMGDYKRAADPLERALEIKTKALGADHPGTLIALHGLAALKSSQRRFDEAEQIYRRALASAERTLGADHVMTANIEADLGNVLSQQGKHDEALKRLRSGIALLEQRQGPNSAELFEPVNNLASALIAAGSAGEAEPMLRRALSLAEQSIGPDSEPAATAMSNLVWCLHSLKKDDEARQLAARHLEHSCRTWDELLNFGSEAQLEQAFRMVRNNGVGETLGDAILAATIALRFKDSLASSLAENQQRARAASKNSSTGKLAVSAEQARKKLRDLVQQQGPPKVIAKAREDAESAEKALARKLSRLGKSRSAMKVTPEAVAAVLPPGTVLVEFTSHVIIDQQGMREQGVRGAYSAIIIAKGREPQLIRLGDDVGIEQQIRAFLKMVSEPSDKSTEAELNAAAESGAKALHKTLLAPVIAALPPDTKTLVLSPDSLLNAVPFAALMDTQGRFVAEDYALRYVASGRDLLIAPHPRSSTKTGVLLGNPAYQRPVSVASAARDISLAEVGRGLGFSELPGTATEIAGLKTQFSAKNWSVKLLSGEAATERAVTTLVAPVVLHLATHGFFLDGSKTNALLHGTSESLFASSMANSGLVFAGGDSTVRHWVEGKVPSAADDGILTAAEAVSLDLDGTELVTLSACETGLGLSMSGTGVAGLKRALMLAGARHTLTTLWQVNDEETAHFMQSFYTRFLAGEDPGAALTATQADELQRLRKETGTWFAINGAAPFVLTATSRF